MAFQVLKDCRTYCGGYNLTGYTNKIELNYSAEELDDTVFGATAKSRTTGLKDTSLNEEGFWEADGTDAESYKVDDIIMSKFALIDEVITVSPDGADAGDAAYSFLSTITQYVPSGAVGQFMAFTVDAKGVDVLVRGTIMENGAKTATANGTARQLGAVGAGQKLYASMHVIAASGTSPTLDLIIQSDDAQGFASATNRITFARKTAIGSEWATPVAGEITDTWWRAAWTIGGTNPSFTVVVFVGIQ